MHGGFLRLLLPKNDGLISPILIAFVLAHFPPFPRRSIPLHTSRQFRFQRPRRLQIDQCPDSREQHLIHHRRFLNSHSLKR